MTNHVAYCPDAQEITNTSVDDLDEDTVKDFLLRRFETACKVQGINAESVKQITINELASYIGFGLNAESLLKNIGLVLPSGNLTLAALLLFGKNPQCYFPALTVKCISFFGSDVAGTKFKDKVNEADMDGNLRYQYHVIMAFLKRNLL